MTTPLVQRLRSVGILSCIFIAACGGGGASEPIGDAPSAVVADAPVPVVVVPHQPAKSAPDPVNPNCVQVAKNILCDLIPSPDPIGVGVAPGTFPHFTNRTGMHLQIDSVQAYTGEQVYWSEWCAYMEQGITGQPSAGVGEVGCVTKNPGEDYPPLTWGSNTGLSVAPGQTVILNSHTEPAGINHTYSLMVRVQTTGLHAWRAPQYDEVIPCNNQAQTTKWTPWQNSTGRTLHVSGATIYSVSGNGASPDALSGQACFYVLDANGQPKHTNCDAALAKRGNVEFPVVLVEPGEYIAAQAVNSCQAPALWDWVAWLRVW